MSVTKKLCPTCLQHRVEVEIGEDDTYCETHALENRSLLEKEEKALKKRRLRSLQELRKSAIQMNLTPEELQSLVTGAATEVSEGSEEEEDEEELPAREDVVGEGAPALDTKISSASAARAARGLLQGAVENDAEMRRLDALETMVSRMSKEGSMGRLLFGPTSNTSGKTIYSKIGEIIEECRKAIPTQFARAYPVGLTLHVIVADSTKLEESKAKLDKVMDRYKLLKSVPNLSEMERFLRLPSTICYSTLSEALGARPKIITRLPDTITGQGATFSLSIWPNVEDVIIKGEFLNEQAAIQVKVKDSFRLLDRRVEGAAYIDELRSRWSNYWRLDAMVVPAASPLEPSPAYGKGPKKGKGRGNATTQGGSMGSGSGTDGMGMGGAPGRAATRGFGGAARGARGRPIGGRR